MHEKSNTRADLSQPLGEGDDQDEWAFLFGLLLDDAISRCIDQDAFYSLSDPILAFSVTVQGYEYLHEKVINAEISRIKFMHEIWRNMPETFYKNFVSELVRLNMS